MSLQESVPAALTKDKKRVHGDEISVHLAWKSTLYVTNFPPSMDDSGMRALFGKVKELPRHPLSVTDGNWLSMEPCLMSGGRVRSLRAQGDSATFNLRLRSVISATHPVSIAYRDSRMRPRQH